MKLLFTICLMLVCTVSHAKNLTQAECVDGYSVAVVMNSHGTQAVHGYQMLDSDGDPQLCGERLKNAMEKARLMNEFWFKQFKTLSSAGQ